MKPLQADVLITPGRLKTARPEGTPRAATPVPVRPPALEATLAEERERRRLSVAVHDQVLQPLALARLVLAGTGADGNSGAETSTRALVLVDEAISAARALTFDLASPVFHELGLEAGLQEICVRATRLHGLPVSFFVEGTRRTLTQEPAHVLHRAGREFLHNALKHARASRIDLTLAYTATAAVLVATDNGVGFAEAGTSANPARGLGLGLSSLRHQLDALGGWLRSGRPSEGGARVEAGVPW